MTCRNTAGIVLLMILAIGIGITVPLGVAQDAIDMDRAKTLWQKRQKGEALSKEEQAYLQKAREIRAQQRPGGPQTREPVARPRGGGTRTPNVGRPTTGLTPLCCMAATENDKGEGGGLYGDGKNTPPEALLAHASKQLARIRPLDADGRPDRDGKIVLVSIGMSNTTQEFSAFKRAIDADPRKSPQVLLVDCAQGGQSASEWTVRHPERTWSELDRRLAAAGLTPEQVQVLWVKQAELRPRPDAMDNARVLQEHLVEILNRAQARFANLRIAYLSSRTYGGYSGRHPEPESFATAFAVRWLIQEQAKGAPELNWDAEHGPVKAPLALWGPYFWGDGTNARACDGLVWDRSDFVADGTHPSEAGKAKVVKMLTAFFTTDPVATSWFTKPGS